MTDVDERNYPLNYYTQVQLQLGVLQLPWCDSVVYMYKGPIMTMIPFDKDYFQRTVQNVSNFYFKWYLLKFLSKAPNESRTESGS